MKRSSSELAPIAANYPTPIQEVVENKEYSLGVDNAKSGTKDHVKHKCTAPKKTDPLF